MNEAIPRPITGAFGTAAGAGAAAPPPVTNGTTTTATRTTRTILRIKRRRSETPIPCIRLEGLVTNTNTSSNAPSVPGSAGVGGAFGDDTLHREEGNFQHSSRRSNIHKRQRSSAVLWKRFDPNDENGKSNSIINHHEDSNERRSGEKYRIVDAVLEEGEDNFVNSGNKRRKLTLLDSSTVAESPLLTSCSPSKLSSPKKKKKVALKVLDPLTRIVDDSLQDVLVGEKTVESHYRQLTTDPRFTLRDLSSQRKWMTWSLDGTNILHCCALWNDASIANELLQRFGDNGGSDCYGSGGYDLGAASIRSALMEAVDGDGRTPYEVAQLIGHERVCEVLEIYGGDTSNYVYDVFYLDGDGVVKTAPGDAEEDQQQQQQQQAVGVDGDGDNDNENGSPTNGIMTAELTSGVGYWTPEGELILETGPAYERRSRSLSQETDIDSNCEEYGGNDYPDEYDEYGDGDNDEYGDGDGDGGEEYGDGSGADNYANAYSSKMEEIKMLNRKSVNNDGKYGISGDDDDDDDDGYGEYDWEQDLQP